MPALAQHLNRYVLLFILCLVLQAAFWRHTNTLRPAMDVVPPPPGKSTLHALAFGDDEFYFRVEAIELQNFGDEFGRNTSLRYYDYSRLYEWLMLLDTLNNRSDMLPAMSAYYFSQIQTPNDVRYLAHYLYVHSIRNVGANWWWLMQDIYLAAHKLHDMDLALKVAKPMVNPAVPVWAQQMVAVVYSQRGEMEDALRIMNTIRDNADTLSDRDLRYMRYFVEERTKKLDEMSKKRP